METTVKNFEQITPDIILEWKSEKEIIFHVASPIKDVKLSAYRDDTLGNKILKKIYRLGGIDEAKIRHYSIKVTKGLFFTFGVREDEKSLLNKLIDIAIEAVEVSKNPPW